MRLFGDILGHEREKLILERMIEQDEIPDFLIFEGPSGIGKSTIAYRFCKYLMCKDNNYEACKNTNIFTSPDFIYVLPDGVNPPLSPEIFIRPREFDSTKFIKIEQVKDIKKRLSRSGTFSAKRRVVLVLNGENLNHEAQNSLLKLLEEPPPKTVIIFVVSLLRAILPTVLSRGKQISFNPVPYSEFIKYPFNTDVSTLMLFKMSEGSIGKAKKIIESWIFEIRSEFIGHLIDRNFKAIGELFSEITGDRNAVHSFVDMYGTIAHDMLLLYDMKKSIMNLDIKDKILKLSGAFSRATARDMLDMAFISEKYLKSNVNSKVVLALLLKPFTDNNFRDRFRQQFEFFYE